MAEGENGVDQRCRDASSGNNAGVRCQRRKIADEIADGASASLSRECRATHACDGAAVIREDV